METPTNPNSAKSFADIGVSVLWADKLEGILRRSPDCRLRLVDSGKYESADAVEKTPARLEAAVSAVLY